MAKITWKDLPKPQGLFTRRSAIMVTLDTKKMIQQYALNTKLNVVQYTYFNGSLYFRTLTAKERGLNWAIKADSFTLPVGLIASLEPSPGFSPIEKKGTRPSKPATRTTGKSKQKSAKKTAKPKSEEVPAVKQTLFSKLLKKLRRK